MARLSLPSLEDVTFDNAADYDLEPHQLVSDDYGACQDLGDRCLTEPRMPRAIRVPSAALPGTQNLVLFGPRVAIPFLLEPLDHDDSPTSVAADDALPPDGLIARVRHFEQAHPELEAWKKGRRFSFIEPPIERLE